MRRRCHGRASLGHAAARAALLLHGVQLRAVGGSVRLNLQASAFGERQLCVCVHAARSTRDDLVAEPAGARLREKCPYWFDFGLALAAQCAGEAAFAGLAPLVSDAFRGRYKSLLTRAHTAVDCEEKLAFLRLLTREERHGACCSNSRRAVPAAALFKLAAGAGALVPPLLFAVLCR